MRQWNDRTPVNYLDPTTWGSRAAEIGYRIQRATVTAQGRHDKVRIFKMRRRKHYQKRQGHRQNYTELEIGAVQA